MSEDMIVQPDNNSGTEIPTNNEQTADADSSFKNAEQEEQFVKSERAYWKKLLAASDLMLGSKTIVEDTKKSQKVNCIEITVESSDEIFIRFSDRTNYVTGKIPIECKGMEYNSVFFFKDDLKNHINFCSDDEFIIQKVGTAYRTNLFDGYCYIQPGREFDRQKHKNVFDDGFEGEPRAFISETVIRQLLRPITEVLGKRSKKGDERVEIKNEKMNTNRVYFCNNHAFIFCADESFMMLPYPLSMLDFPECTLSASFMAVLSQLLSYKQERTIGINFHHIRGIKMIADGFEFKGSVYKKLDKNTEEKCTSVIESLKDSSFTPINNELLADIANFSCLGKRLKKELEFNYGAAGNVTVKYTVIDDGNKKEYSYPVKISVGSPQREDSQCHKPLRRAVNINSQTLNRFIRAFEKDDSLEIFIKEEYVILI